MKKNQEKKFYIVNVKIEKNQMVMSKRQDHLTNVHVHSKLLLCNLCVELISDMLRQADKFRQDSPLVLPIVVRKYNFI